MIATDRLRHASPWWAVTALLLLHAGLALHAVAHKSVTADEILHVTGGYTYWKFNDYRVQPENGNLPQRVAGLPAVLSGAKPPPFAENIYWQTSDAPVLSHQFFYEVGNDHWPLLMAGRAAVLVFGLATGLLIFAWSRALFGTFAGFFSLSLYVLCPNFLAHNALATSDSASVFFLLAATGAFWRHLHHPTRVNAMLSVLVFGLACVAKYSALLLAPVFLWLSVWRMTTEPRGSRMHVLLALIRTAAIHALGAWVIIWAFYGFRFSAFAADVTLEAPHFIQPWDKMLPFIGVHGKIIALFRGWKILPDAFLFGYGWVVQSAKARGAFLAGDHGILGWPEFFPLAFLWKTPLAVLVMLPLGIASLALRWRSRPAQIGQDLTRVAPLVVLAMVYWTVSITSHLNIGHRHILPTYPPLFILVGGLSVAAGVSRKLRTLAAMAIVAAQALASVRVHPHYLAFFNTLAGGPANGWRLLVDSSLDWGQDLPGLAQWLRENNTSPRPERVHLAYFGSGEPGYYGIHATRLPFLNGFKLPPVWYRPSGGLYCISATLLQQVYSPVSRPWTNALEEEYQKLRAADPLFERYWTRPDSRPDLERQISPEQWTRAWRRYDQLRFTRLCYYLRARGPDAMVGYSILIFRLSESEVEAVLQKPPSL